MKFHIVIKIENRRNMISHVGIHLNFHENFIGNYKKVDSDTMHRL